MNESATASHSSTRHAKIDVGGILIPKSFILTLKFHQSNQIHNESKGGATLGQVGQLTPGFLGKKLNVGYFCR